MAQRGHGGSGQNSIEKILEGLLAKCQEDPGYAYALYSVCIVLMQRVSADRPLALRQAWAMELYRLADALAENASSSLASKDEPD
jgi:hypothetical protein